MFLAGWPLKRWYISWKAPPLQPYFNSLCHLQLLGHSCEATFIAGLPIGILNLFGGYRSSLPSIFEKPGTLVIYRRIFLQLRAHCAVYAVLLTSSLVVIGCGGGWGVNKPVIQPASAASQIQTVVAAQSA